jgi:hypothetical protein
VTIPANQAIGYIVVKGNYTAYNATGRVDTLIFTFNDDKTSAVPASSFNPSFTLQVKGPCFEGDVNLQDLAGTYNNTFDDGQYGPYTTVVTPGTTTGTTGTITISNFYNAGFHDITVKLDWTNPANRTVTFSPQNVGVDGGIFDPSLAGQTTWVYPVAQKGTFSVCHSTIQLNYQIAFFPMAVGFAPEFTVLSR